MVPQNICIAFLGFDSDRIYLPVQMLKCDKLYLIQRSDHYKSQNAMYNYRLIVRALGKRFIEDRIVPHGHVFERVNAVKKIFEAEKENRICINLSTGSKLDAIAGMMAVMLFRKIPKDVTPFYAVPVDTGRINKAARRMKKINYSETKGVKDIQIIWVLDLQSPKPEIIEALKIISKHGRKIRKKLLVQTLCKQGLLEGFMVDNKDHIKRIDGDSSGDKARRNAQSGAFHVAENRIIRELRARKAIKEDEGKPRDKDIELTENGDYLVTIFGD